MVDSTKLNSKCTDTDAVGFKTLERMPCLRTQTLTKGKSCLRRQSPNIPWVPELVLQTAQSVILLTPVCNPQTFVLWLSNTLAVVHHAEGMRLASAGRLLGPRHDRRCATAGDAQGPTGISRRARYRVEEEWSPHYWSSWILDNTYFFNSLQT